MKNFWKNVWDSKGNSDSKNLLYLCGWEHLDISIDSKQIVNSIIEVMNIQKNDSILEIGCGAGFLSREFKDFNFKGIDYSESLIQKHKEFFPTNNVLVAEANSLPFEDSSFNKVFSSGVFQYLPDLDYLLKTIDEMIRVARDSIMLVDLKNESTHENHFYFKKEILEDMGFIFSECLYDKNKSSNYNAYLKLEDL